MRNFILTAAAALLIGAEFCSAELVENGDFKKNLPYWHVHRHHGYAPKPMVKHKPGMITFQKMVPNTNYYLSMATAVNIEKGKNYILSYEIKGPATGNYTVRIADQGDHMDRNVKPVNHVIHTGTVTENWETVELPFTGTFDTKSIWYKKIQMLRKTNKLSDGRTPFKDQNKFAAIKPENSDRPCESTLSFFIGLLRGEVSFRNVSVKEVP